MMSCGKLISRLSLTGTEQGIVMVEAGGSGVVEDKVVDAIEFGHDCCRKIIAGIRELQSKAGKPKRAFAPVQVDQELYAKDRCGCPRGSYRCHGYGEVP